MVKLDILIVAAHPDDGELGCAGTILAHVAMGKKVGILDLTQGELGSRGSVETRHEEAQKSAQLLGLSIRENLKMADGFFLNDELHQRKIIQALRKYQPDTVLLNAFYDRHPDHGRGSKLAQDACFLSGLVKIETEWEGKLQAPWRPKAVFHYVQDTYIQPSFIIDITPYWQKKREVILAFSSQFYDKNKESKEPTTYISTPEFLEFVEARACEFGHAIGVKYGEGFCKQKPLGVKSLEGLL